MLTLVNLESCEVVRGEGGGGVGVNWFKEDLSFSLKTL